MHIPQEDLQDAQRWAEQAAADADAERAYQRMMDEDEGRAEQAAADADAERYADAPPSDVEHDVF